MEWYINIGHQEVRKLWFEKHVANRKLRVIRVLMAPSANESARQQQGSAGMCNVIRRAAAAAAATSCPLFGLISPQQIKQNITKHSGCERALSGYWPSIRYGSVSVSWFISIQRVWSIRDSETDVVFSEIIIWFPFAVNSQRAVMYRHRRIHAGRMDIRCLKRGLGFQELTSFFVTSRANPIVVEKN